MKRDTRMAILCITFALIIAGLAVRVKHLQTNLATCNNSRATCVIDLSKVERELSYLDK